MDQEIQRLLEAILKSTELMITTSLRIMGNADAKYMTQEQAREALPIVGSLLESATSCLAIIKTVQNGNLPESNAEQRLRVIKNDPSH